MAKHLVIVESPTKANTIKKYLGKGFAVKATVGHIRDLPKKKLGVDLDNDFAPTYETVRGKKKVIDDIVKAALKAEAIYLAPDPDREGEAIAWHVQEAVKEAQGKSEKGPLVHRVLFHEITKKAVNEALEKPLTLNMNLYEAQQARRILDRLVGYKVSPLLWDKVRRGLSAGRVQSVALRIICERDAEIAAFVPVEYWSVVAQLEGSKKPAFEAKLVEWQGEKPVLGDESTTNAVVDILNQHPWTLSKITKKARNRNPQPPFITSKLQQEAARKLGFTAKKTMMLAQRLYEGIELGDEGPVGLITYMRTDSVRVSDTAVGEVRDLILKRYGDKYLPDAPNVYKNKKKGTQDAHEAIRPTMVDHSPDDIKGFVERDMYRLYDLIWKRFVASQMTPANFDQTTMDIAAGDGAARFRASGSIMTFDGFITVYLEGSDDESATNDDGTTLPPLEEGEVLSLHELTPNQHFTQPPPRYTEASLVKVMEEEGIGRPSTYAAIMSNIQDKGYVEKQQGRFFGTDLGRIVNSLLVESFPNVFDVGFTAQMENQLDDVEEGTRNWVKALHEFYEPFAKTLASAKENMRDIKRQEIPTDHTCEKCEQVMVIKWGRHGEFLACSAYPDCKSTSEFRREDGKIILEEEETTDEQCSKCEAPMVVKQGRYGRFLACSRYPDCKTTKGVPVGVKCPQDNGDLVEKRSRRGKVFYSCENYPTCEYALWDKPVAETCPQCQHPFLTEKYTKRSGVTIKCVNKECGYTRSGEDAGDA